MGIRIRFCRATVKELTAAWQCALRRGERRVLQRVTALLLTDEFDEFVEEGRRVQYFERARFESCRSRHSSCYAPRVSASPPRRSQSRAAVSPTPLVLSRPG